MASLISKESLFQESPVEDYFFYKEDNLEEVLSRLWTMRTDYVETQLTQIKDLLLNLETTEPPARSLNEILSKLLVEKSILEKGCSKEFISFKSRSDLEKE